MGMTGSEASERYISSGEYEALISRLRTRRSARTPLANEKPSTAPVMSGAERTRRWRDRQRATRPAQVARTPRTPRLRKPQVKRDCVVCGLSFTVGRRKVTCGSAPCQAVLQAARRRNRDHVQRVSVSDVTARHEVVMRRKARKCPLCSVRMTDDPLLPHSKELDHIVPISQGGTHTVGNVRIICRKCNQVRPKDGSDYTGPLTLWAQQPGTVTREPRQRTTCGKGLHKWIPENIGIRSGSWGTQNYCIPCLEATSVGRMRQCQCGAMFPAPGRTFMCPDCITATARKAADLHASGLTWSQVAAETGYRSAEGARYAAKRIGYVALQTIVPSGECKPAC